MVVIILTLILVALINEKTLFPKTQGKGKSDEVMSTN